MFTCPSLSLIVLVMTIIGADTMVDTLPLAAGAVGVDET